MKMRKIGRNESGPTKAEIGWRHREIKMKHSVIKHNNGDFHIEREPHKMGDIDILREIIRDAKKRIEMYKQLDSGLWSSIFRTDNSEAIADEERLIGEWERMITEIEVWVSRYDNQR